MNRRILVCVIGALVFASGFGAARAQNEIPNGDFESWSAGEPVDWQTSNLSFPGGVTQTADAHSGSSAAQGQVVEFYGYYVPPIIQSTYFPGFPVSQRWGSLKGYYKLNSVGADVIVVFVEMFLNGTVVGGGVFIDSVGTSTYTEFMAPIEYADGSVPDSAYIQISLGPGGDGETWHQGSSFKIDDLVFSMDSGSVECPIAVSGDADGSGAVKSSDIIYLVNYVLKLGPEPLPCPAAGDADGSGEVKSSDIIYLVNYVLKGGPSPVDICTLIPSVWSCP